MNKRVKIFVLLCIIILSFSFCVHASGNGYIVKFKEGFVPDVKKYSLFEIAQGKNLYSAESIEWKEDFKEYIEYIEENSEAFLIEGESGVMTFSLSEIDELYYPWMEIINASSGWLMGSYGNDIRVGIIDTGCYVHEDLKNNLLPGKNFLDNNSDTNDDIGHGTHVTGIIAAEIDNGGIAGVAPKVKVIPLKCFEDGRNTYADTLAAAVYEAVDVFNCDIINMSWGLSSDNKVLKDAIDYADSKGVILVAAVGNSYSDTVFYPAGYENVIGVGSVTEQKVKSDFSQYNNSVMIVAPGEYLKSTYNDGGFILMKGTSQAAPVISGIAAIALSADRNLTSARFREILISTAEDLGDEGYDVNYGYGLANEMAILETLLENMDYYVSPVNKSGNTSYVKIKNNTEEPLTADSIFSRYSGNKFIGGSKVQLTLQPGEKTTVQTDSGNEELRHFLWYSLESMKPVTSKR